MTGGLHSHCAACGVQHYLIHSVLGDFWLEIKHQNLVLLRKLQYIVLLNVKESPTQLLRT